MSAHSKSVLELDTTNRLLAAMRPSDQALLRPYLKRAFLPSGGVLFDPDEPVHRVYFPEDGLVSLVCIFEDGSTSEMAMVGKEGMIGVGASLDGHTAIGRHVVQAPVSAWAADATQFAMALRDSESLRMVCAKYVQALLAQSLQTAACNSVHSVEERLARWLLMASDRVDEPTLRFKQELIAEMLGVRRSSISVVAGMMKNAGLIRYRRGIIEILDRQGLEESSCECYRITRERYRKLLPQAFVQSLSPFPQRETVSVLSRYVA